jgi:methylmalonyl-CoA carboxyltransferase small subunit
MRLKVTVNETVYEVTVEVEEEPLPTLAALALGSPGRSPFTVPAVPAHLSAPASEEKVLRAPVSGTVTSVAVDAGAAVEAGEVLLVLEAMKMETEITAPAAGTVAEVHVCPGEAVAGGQILVTWA